MGKGVVLVHGKADLLIHVTLTVQRFIFWKGMQDHKVIPPVLQPCQRIDQFSENRFFKEVFLQGGHQFVDRKR